MHEETAAEPQTRGRMRAESDGATQGAADDAAGRRECAHPIAQSHSSGHDSSQPNGGELAPLVAVLGPVTDEEISRSLELLDSLLDDDEAEQRATGEYVRRSLAQVRHFELFVNARRWHEIEVTEA